MTHSTPFLKETAAALSVHAHEVFGLMGNGNAHLIDELLKLGLSYTAVRHEAATVAAADAYSRVSKQLAIATTTYGAGFTNALTALAEAVKARTPMLVVVGDEPDSGQRDIDVDQEMLTVALGTRHYRLNPQRATKQIDRAVAYSLKTRKPVVVSIPYDLVREAGASNGESLPKAENSTSELILHDPKLIAALSRAVIGNEEGQSKEEHRKKSRIFTRPITVQTKLRPPKGQIEEAARLLRSAKRPLVLAGRGAWLANAGQQLNEIAQKLGALTASTSLARGIFNDDTFDLGVTGGFGASEAMQKFAKADVILVVGASLNQFTMRFGELFGHDAQIVRIDLDAVQAPATALETKQLLVQGDAAMALHLLLEELQGQEMNTMQGWHQDVSALRERERVATADSICADGLLDPRAVAERIGEFLPQNTYITQDGGHFIGWANMYWPVHSPERMTMVGTAYQTIGLGFASVAGVAKANPDVTVVLSTGDGGGLMALADLETAVRTAQSLVIVVWNDAAYGAEVHLYGRMGLDEGPMRIPTADFAALAAAVGARGVRVEKLSDLDALREWVDGGSQGAILLDCRISASVVAPYQAEIQKVNGVMSL